MYCEVNHECRLLSETFLANITNEWLLASMKVHVKMKLVGLGEFVSTGFTVERLLPVFFHVESEVVCRNAVPSTEVTKVSPQVLNSRVEIEDRTTLVYFEHMFLHVGLVCVLATT